MPCHTAMLLSIDSRPHRTAHLSSLSLFVVCSRCRPRSHRRRHRAFDLSAYAFVVVHFAFKNSALHVLHTILYGANRSSIVMSLFIRPLQIQVSRKLVYLPLIPFAPLSFSQSRARSLDPSCMQTNSSRCARCVCAMWPCMQCVRACCICSGRNEHSGGFWFEFGFFMPSNVCSYAFGTQRRHRRNTATKQRTIFWVRVLCRRKTRIYKHVCNVWNRITHFAALGVCACLCRLSCVFR